MSQQLRLTYSLAALVVVLTAIIIALLANHNPTSQPARLATEKTPLATNTTTSQPLPKASPDTTTTTVATSTPAHVVTPSSPVRQTATSSQTSVTPASNSTPPAPSPTPLSILTTLIANLEVGQSANITASSVVIPGPISDATGQPIVFTANGQTYFAYTQEQQPNFNTTPAQTASTMAIVAEPAADSGVALSQAHLDKTGILVDEDELAVGYSSGGD